MDDEESTMLETTSLPSRAMVIQHHSNKAQVPQSGSVALPAVIHDSNGSTLGEVGNMGNTDFQSSKGITNSGHESPTGHIANSFSASQIVLYKNLNDGNQRIKVLLEEFGKQTDVPPLGADSVSVIIYELYCIICGFKEPKKVRGLTKYSTD